MTARARSLQVAVRESRRAGLESLRDLLAARLEECEVRETASIARQLADVLKALDELPAEQESALDELSKRRTSRRAKVQDRATGSGVKRGS